jgi:hypothetical protein
MLCHIYGKDPATNNSYLKLRELWEPSLKMPPPETEEDFIRQSPQLTAKRPMLPGLRQNKTEPQHPDKLSLSDQPQQSPSAKEQNDQM